MYEGLKAYMNYNISTTSPDYLKYQLKNNDFARKGN